MDMDLATFSQTRKAAATPLPASPKGTRKAKSAKAMAKAAEKKAAKAAARAAAKQAKIAAHNKAMMEAADNDPKIQARRLKNKLRNEAREIKRLEKMHAAQLKADIQKVREENKRMRDEMAEAAFLAKQAKAKAPRTRKAKGDVIQTISPEKEAKELYEKAAAAAAAGERAKAQEMRDKADMLLAKSIVKAAPPMETRKAGRGSQLVAYNALVKKYRALGASMAEARKQATAEMKDAKSMTPK